LSIVVFKVDVVLDQVVLPLLEVEQVLAEGIDFLADLLQIRPLLLQLVPLAHLGLTQLVPLIVVFVTKFSLDAHDLVGHGLHVHEGHLRGLLQPSYFLPLSVVLFNHFLHVLDFGL